MYKTIAYDPEVGAARVWGTGETEAESIRNCEHELHCYVIRRVEWDFFDFKLETANV